MTVGNLATLGGLQTFRLSARTSRVPAEVRDISTTRPARAQIAFDDT